MASAAPSNPFDGFDTYSTVAQQPPQQMQQQQQPPPNQWGQQPTQQQQQPVNTSNPFAAAPAPVPPTTNAPSVNPFAMPQQTMSPQVSVASPGMVPPQQQPGMVQPQQPVQQPIMQPQQPVVGMPQYPPQQAGPQLQIAQHPHQPTQQPPMQQQPHQQQLVPMAPNAIVTSPWALQPGVGGVPPAVS